MTVGLEHGSQYGLNYRAGGWLRRMRFALASSARFLPHKMFRRLPLYVADLLAGGFAFAMAATLRYGFGASDPAYMRCLAAVPIFVVICATIFPAVGMYNKKWRYASVKDLLAMTIAAAVSSAGMLCVTLVAPRIASVEPGVLGIEFFVLVCVLAAVRLSARLDEVMGPGLARARSAGKDCVPILVIGAGSAADHYLRALQRDSGSAYWPVGVLDSDSENQGLLLRGVPVLGRLEDFEDVINKLTAKGRRPRHLVFTDAPARTGDAAKVLIEWAESEGVAVSRLCPPTELRKPKADGDFELRPIELTDLLERSQATLDRAAPWRLVRGRRILVTGAGGSIGKELAFQIAALQPAELVLLDSCELNLYAVDLELREASGHVPWICYLCNVREAARVDEIFDRHHPEIVFHAAALKHVPIVELNPCEGVLTNVVGTMNVALAAKRTNVLAAVQVSTDKAVNPTSVMGMTKRLAELYCQALDLEGQKNRSSSRFMTVRFGNVLGSSGSLIPLFQRQLARGGPLTVTHKDMKRFFMTIREAVELTLQASAHGLERCLARGEIFVLDMGEPIRIIDIARRMIRLAGFTPDQEINIEIIGLRPGEKLFEELFDSSEDPLESPVPGVLSAVPRSMELQILQEGLLRLKYYAEQGDTHNLFKVMAELLPNCQNARLVRAKAESDDVLELSA